MDWITLVLQLGTQVMRLMPDVEEKNRRKFEDLKLSIIHERSLEQPDDNRLIGLCNELEIFISSILLKLK